MGLILVRAGWAGGDAGGGMVRAQPLPLGLAAAWGSARKALSFLEVRRKEKLSFISLRRQNGSLIPLNQFLLFSGMQIQFSQHKNSRLKLFSNAYFRGMTTWKHLPTLTRIMQVLYKIFFILRSKYKILVKFPVPCCFLSPLILQIYFIFIKSCLLNPIFRAYFWNYLIASFFPFLEFNFLALPRIEMKGC